MILFGLTGGVASGKSLAGKRIRERGIPVIDADLLAREVVLPETDGWRELVEFFGHAILNDDRTLRREKLASIIFTDADARKKVNQILHPKIKTLTQARAASLQHEGKKYACYEAALIIENGLAEQFRPLIVVMASEKHQLERLMNRDRITLEEAQGRLKSQTDNVTRQKYADFELWNEGSVEQLYQALDVVIDKVTHLSHTSP